MLRIIKMCAMVCAFVTTVASAAQQQPAMQKDSMVKLRNCQEFDTYLKSGKPFVTYFSALRCGPCNAFHDTLEEIIAANSDITFVNVIDEVCQNAPTLLNRYGVRSYPTFMFFDKSGNKVSDVTGMRDSTKSLIEVGIQKLRSGAPAQSAQPMPAQQPVQAGSGVQKPQPVVQQRPVMQPQQVQQPVRPAAPAQPTMQQPMPKPGQVVMVPQCQQQNVQPVVTYHKQSSMAGAVQTEPQAQPQNGRRGRIDQRRLQGRQARRPRQARQEIY